MIERRVTQTGKDEEGDITKLCNPNESWSPRSKQKAIQDIESGDYAYYVRTGTTKTYVHVVEGPSGKYLRTTADTSSEDNLDNLPNC